MKITLKPIITGLDIIQKIGKTILQIRLINKDKVYQYLIKERVYQFLKIHGLF